MVWLEQMVQGRGKAGSDQRKGQEIEQRPNTGDHLLGQSPDFVSDLGKERLSFQLFILKLPNQQKS